MFSAITDHRRIVPVQPIAGASDLRLRKASSWLWENLSPLPKQAFVCGPMEGRPTEYYACWLAYHGWIPGKAYSLVEYLFPPPDQKSVTPLDFDYVVKPHHPESVGRECTECGQSYPLVSRWWHRDPRGKGGWHSQCKPCRNAARAAYYKRTKR